MKEIGLLGVLLGASSVGRSVGLDDHEVVQHIKRVCCHEFFANLRQILLESIKAIGLKSTADYFHIDHVWLSMLTNLQKSSKPPKLVIEQDIELPVKKFKPEEVPCKASDELVVDEWFLQEEVNWASVDSMFTFKRVLKEQGVIGGFSKAAMVAEAVAGGNQAFVDVGNKYNIDAGKIRKWCVQYQRTGNFTTSKYLNSTSSVLTQAFEELKNA